MLPLTLQNFINIENAAQIEIDRLIPLSPSGNGTAARSKAQQIMPALDRLYLMYVHQNPGAKNLHDRLTILTQINPAESSRIDLSTTRAMLHARISDWNNYIEPWEEQGMEFSGRPAGFSRKISVVQALNISTNNIFNTFSFGTGQTWGPLWGKTTALENVERRLGINTYE